MKATLQRQYRHPRKGLLAGSQGSFQILPGGNVFMGWGAEPYYTELQEDGTSVLDARFATGTSYRALRFESSATPTELPAIALKTRGRASDGVHVLERVHRDRAMAAIGGAVCRQPAARGAGRPRRVRDHDTGCRRDDLCRCCRAWRRRDGVGAVGDRARLRVAG